MIHFEAIPATKRLHPNLVPATDRFGPDLIISSIKMVKPFRKPVIDSHHLMKGKVAAAFTQERQNLRLEIIGFSEFYEFPSEM